MQEAARMDTTASRILIVDDEEDIRKTLEGVFQDEGYLTCTAANGDQALEMIKSESPDLILLDIWMPGRDGLEVLSQIKELSPDTPVVMISGHANIATAMKATRLGADDFIEKPLDLEGTLQSVQRILSGELKISESEESLDQESEFVSGKIGLDRAWEPAELNRQVFDSQPSRGAAIKQRTLSKAAVLYGRGLHSGKKSGLILEPLPADSGIHFASVSETAVVPAHVDYVESTGWSTTLRLGNTLAGTIEHLMSALHAYRISNLLIKCDGEVPVMDGSALEFCRLIEESGIEEQDGEWFELAVDRQFRVGSDEEFLQIEPAEGFTIDYTLRYPEPIGEQQLSFTLSSPEEFKKLIAPARTFGFVKDIGALQAAGLAQGGRFDNFVLIGEEGAINSELRFPDEQVRHKILDAIGDLYLLGRPLRGKVTAKMTGHSDNYALLNKLYSDLYRKPQSS